MNTLDPRLKDVLDERGRGVQVAVSDLADRAIARDRRNRRRELAGMAAAAALALAVAAPVGLDLLGPDRAGQIPAVPSPSVVSTQVTPDPSPTTGAPQPQTTPTMQVTGVGDAVRVTLADGAPTATTDLGYVSDSVYTEGSTSIALPAELKNPQSVARLGDGLLAVPTMGGDYVVVDARGRAGKSIATVSAPVVGDNRSHVAALDRAEDLVYYDSSGTEVARLEAAQCECSTEEAHGSWQPVGIVGPLVYANRGHDKGHAVWNTATGEVVRAKGTIALFNEEALLALVTAGSDVAGDGDSFCRELVDLNTGTTRWRLCGAVHFTGFSPDGEYLVGTGLMDGIDPERTTGKFPGLVVLRTMDASFVLQGGSDGTDQSTRGVGTTRMSRDHSLTVVTWSSDGIALQRCELNGSCAVITEPKVALEAGGDPIPPYLLSAN
jgi:hypothetical protein